MTRTREALIVAALLSLGALGIHAAATDQPREVSTAQVTTAQHGPVCGAPAP